MTLFISARVSCLSLGLLLLTLALPTGHPAAADNRRGSAAQTAQGLGRPKPPGNPGAGSSGPCGLDRSLLPVTPTEAQPENRTLYAGKTSAAHPSVWFYLPYESVVSARFSLTEWQEARGTTADRPLYSRDIAIPAAAPGIIRIPLPTTVTLTSDRWYEARLSIRVICQSGFAPEAEFTRAWVRREAIAPDLQRQIGEAATPLQKATLYARAGFWYDALSILSPARTLPNASDWRTLLREFGLLEAIASAPPRNCCEPQE